MTLVILVDENHQKTRTFEGHEQNMTKSLV
jgi:hypothetical protein